MRFLRITFRCFGPFEEQTLDLSGPDGLQVIFGENEAGKSSAHDGWCAFLFGFPGQLNYDFKFRYNQFRIHALLKNSRGEELECIRRKGHKDTLRKSCDKEIVPENTLSSFLGGVDKDQYEQLFGLNMDRLRDGGQEISEGRGEIGGLLFAAVRGNEGNADPVATIARPSMGVVFSRRPQTDHHRGPARTPRIGFQSSRFGLTRPSVCRRRIVMQ